MQLNEKGLSLGVAIAHVRGHLGKQRIDRASEESNRGACPTQPLHMRERGFQTH